MSKTWIMGGHIVIFGESRKETLRGWNVTYVNLYVVCCCGPVLLKIKRCAATFSTGPASGFGRRATPEDNDLSFNTSADATAHMEPAMTVASKNVTSDDILAAVVASLEDDKAEDIVQIPLRGKTEMADFMVIASGRSTRQVAAVSEKLTERMKQAFGIICKVEGAEIGDWVLVDCGDVIVHVFRPEVREFYQLEKMWLPTGAAEA